MARNVELFSPLDTYIFTNEYQGDRLMSGMLFAVLLNFKHIYMYLAVR